jgi:hypothetical protein
MSIEIMPGAAVSPEVLLHRLLEDMSDTKGVIVLSVDPHGAVQVYTSQITLHDLAYAALKLQSYAAKTIDGDTPDGTEYRKPTGVA